MTSAADRSVSGSIAFAAAALRDQAGAALVADVIPQPTDRDAEPVAYTDQEIDVRNAPYPPCQRAAQLDPSKVDHRQPLADLREAAGVLVVKGLALFAAQPRLDDAGDVAALLLCRGRDAGHRSTPSSLP